MTFELELVPLGSHTLYGHSKFVVLKKPPRPGGTAFCLAHRSQTNRHTFYIFLSLEPK